MTAQNPTNSAMASLAEVGIPKSSPPRPEQNEVAQPGELPHDVRIDRATETENEKDENAARVLARKKRRLLRRKLQDVAVELMFPNLDRKLKDLSDSPDDPTFEDFMDSDEEEEEEEDEVKPEEKPEKPEEKSDIIHRADLYEYNNRFDRDKWTAELRGSVDDKEPIQIIEGDSTNKSGTVLEVTTMFAVSLSNNNGSPATTSKFGQYNKPVPVRAKIRTYLTIRSPKLLEVLQTIVMYYPILTNWRENLILQEPFCMLLHYQDELLKYRDTLSKSVESPESVATTYEHLTQLIDLLSSRYGAEVKAESDRWRGKPAMCTSEWIWLLFRPGTKVIRLEDGVPSAYLVQWHNREALYGERAIVEPPEFREYRLSFSDPPKPLTVAMWCLDFDGRMIGRRREEVVIQPFTGERTITSLPICPVDFWQDDIFDTGGLSIEDSLVKVGEDFVKLTSRSHCYYNGLTLEFPKQQIDERVMIDSEHFYCNTTDGHDLAPKLGIPDSDNYDGNNNNLPLFMRDPFMLSSTAYDRACRCESSNSPYRSFDNINPAKDKLSNLQLSLCSTKVWGFVLRNRTWNQLSVRCIKPPQFRTNLINDLIIDEELKKMIQSLTKSYTSGATRWSADFIQNKGEGQILLLHGKPGVGKTTTAECVAELTGRPLLPLTCGDLGIEPLVVEANLMKWLKVGTRWEAIVLLDEAEVYLEARETTDLQRNSLVSIFLRALEYYKGILFLTTNRVGTFDDAFVSRIHLIVHYPDFSEENREKVWHKFFSKLSKDRPDIRVDDGTRYYAMKSEEVKQLGWNGREIRNAFSTAVALAEDDNQRDADNRIMLYGHHLQPVVRMSAQFKKKFKDIQGMSEELLAKTKLLRSEVEVSNEISQGKKHSIDQTTKAEIYDASHKDGRVLKRPRS